VTQRASFVVRIPDGIILRDPQTGRVAATGEEYPRDGFWSRRLAAGEVFELEPTIEPQAAPTAERPR
jgi:Protein of unknown function (DUF2635)